MNHFRVKETHQWNVWKKLKKTIFKELLGFFPRIRFFLKNSTDAEIKNATLFLMP